MKDTIVILAYLGPETMLPLASFLAAITGFILMFWRYVFQLIRRMFAAIFRRKQKNINAKTVAANRTDGKEVKG